MSKMTRVKITGEITYDASAICWKLPPPVPTQPIVELLPKEHVPGDPSMRMRELLADMNRPNSGIRITYNFKAVRSVPMLNLPAHMILISYVVQGKETVSMTWVSELVRSLRQCGIIEELYVYDVASNDRLEVPGFEEVEPAAGGAL